MPKAGGRDLVIPDSQMQTPPPPMAGRQHVDMSTCRERASAHLPSNMAGEFPISMLIHCPSTVLGGAVMRLNAAKRNGRMDKRCKAVGVLSRIYLGFFCFDWLLFFFNFNLVLIVRVLGCFFVCF